MQREQRNLKAETIAAVRRYHELSKHHLHRYAPGPGYLDWATQPNPFREFHGAPRLPLPLGADRLETEFAALRAPAGGEPQPLELRSVALLLELALGLSAWKSYGGNRWALRCNPSSGNLHPTEGYVVCPELAGLEGGVHHYHSLSHALERRAVTPTEGWSSAFPPGGLIVGLSSVHWREAWKYGARAYRYCQHDVGHALAALRYAAAALGWRARLLDEWGDAQIAALLGLDRAQDFSGAEAEAPDALLWIGTEMCAPGAAELLSAARALSWQGRANRLSTAHRDWPQIEAVAAAAAKPPVSAVGTDTPLERPALSTPAAGQRAATVIRQRRSAVAFDGRTAIAAPVFYHMLDALLPRPGVPPWDLLPGPPRIHPLFFVHRVTGLDPGLYLLPRTEPAAADLRRALRPEFRWETPPACPSHLPLRLLLPLDARGAAETIACHQEIAADSAFALGMLTELEAGLSAGAWWYRRLHWEAGVLGQVLYLEAEAAGVRGTGIGCFFDDEMHRLLGLADARYQTLYHFTVGGPVEDTRLATHPPYAHLGRPEAT